MAVLATKILLKEEIMRKRKGVAQVLIGLLLVAALVLIPMACKAPEEAPPAAPPVEAPPVAPPAV